MALQGQVVDVTVKEGTVFRGILSSVKTEDLNGIGCTLRMARRVEPGVDLDKVRPFETVLILGRDFVQMFAPNTYLGGERGTASKAFQTDSDISGRELQERELVAWDGGEGVELDAEWMEKAGKAGLDQNGEWDQFAANEELYGIESTFDEELYTTKLNTNLSSEQMAHAAKCNPSRIASHPIDTT